uniref:26S proteasome regulatory complex, non-ATPase subcomplex, Rpn2/Psmd1 subunit n=1 Tax=Tanacetum cinerariifolium TaxID=118510 RepID=A0A699H866_TANCI|nr:26S proteasome regulatory complex, non-ATPase subcomplex, Rpn2/Psmd1 subunit [Tanacetum cinerariifolium]
MSFIVPCQKLPPLPVCREGSVHQPGSGDDLRQPEFNEQIPNSGHDSIIHHFEHDDSHRATPVGDENQFEGNIGKSIEVHVFQNVFEIQTKEVSQRRSLRSSKLPAKLNDYMLDSKDPVENSSQSPPHIDHHCCYGCGDSLDGIFCRRCACESCRNGANIGYNCPPKVSIISNPEPSYNQNIPIYYDDDDDEESSSFLRDIIISELPSCIAITLVLSTEEPKDSLIIGDEHLDTIPEKESDKFIKSSVENLVLNPSDSEDLSHIRSDCDVPVCDDFTTFSNLLFDADDHFSSSDDESFSDEDVPKEIYSNPLFDEEIISIKIDPHHFNADNDSLSLPENELFHFDVPSFPRPPAKPPDDDEIEPDTGVLTVKVVGDISEHYVLMTRLLPTQPTLALNEEKSPHLLSHRGFKAFQLSSESPMMIYEGNNPNLDVPFLTSLFTCLSACRVCLFSFLCAY